MVTRGNKVAINKVITNKVVTNGNKMVKCGSKWEQGGNNMVTKG